MFRTIVRTALSAGMITSAMIGTAAAQTVANGYYTAPSSWDLTIAANTRFVILANFNSQAVLDRETGLVWQRAPSTIVASFVGAQQFCALTGMGTTTGTRLGWRLPTVDELSSLFDRSVNAPPYLPAGHPFTVPANNAVFWSTTYNGPESDARAFAVGYGVKFLGQPVQFILEPQSTNNQQYFWCVRGTR